MKPEPTADWRLNPIAEREIHEGWRLARRQRTNRWLLGLSGALVCPLACLGSCLSLGGLNGSWPAFLVFGAIGLLVVALVRFSIDRGREGERLDVLRKEFGDVKGWLVEMSIRQGEALSGHDVGIVWFEEGWLYFTGGRTSFGLGTADAQGHLTNAYEALDGGPHVVLPLRTRTLAGPVSVELRFLGTPKNDPPPSDENAFRQALQVWFSKGKARRGQLPPLSPGPGLPPVSALRRRAFATAAIWPTLIVLAVAAVSMGNGIGAAILMVAFLGIASWPPAVSPRRCRRALHDREVLDATIEG